MRCAYPPRVTDTLCSFTSRSLLRFISALRALRCSASRRRFWGELSLVVGGSVSFGETMTDRGPGHNPDTTSKQPVRKSQSAAGDEGALRGEKGMVLRAGEGLWVERLLGDVCQALVRAGDRGGGVPGCRDLREPGVDGSECSRGSAWWLLCASPWLALGANMRSTQALEEGLAEPGTHGAAPSH